MPCGMINLTFVRFLQTAIYDYATDISTSFFRTPICVRNTGVSISMAVNPDSRVQGFVNEQCSLTSDHEFRSLSGGHSSVLASTTGIYICPHNNCCILIFWTNCHKNIAHPILPIANDMLQRLFNSLFNFNGRTNGNHEGSILLFRGLLGISAL